MTQEDKELLLRDLCGRLPYGVKGQSYSYEEDIETIETLYEITSDGYVSTIECDTLKHMFKPYLFPISNMTEKQYELLKKSGILSNCSHSYEYVTNIHGSSFIFKGFKTYSLELIEYLNKNHFDYRNLIKKGLAIDCTNLNIY